MELLGDRAMVDAVLNDYRSAPVSEPEKALFGFVEKMNARADQITQADLDSLHAAGWSDEAIFDAITVCALFNFYNRWVDASGIADQPEEHYRAGAKRMAARGYWVTKEE